MLKKISLPSQLFLVLICVALFGNSMPTIIINFFYSISLLIKEFLGFLLPWIVFVFITTGILSFKRNAPIVLSILLGSVLVSNSVVAFFSYFIGKALLPLLAMKIDTSTMIATENLQPLFSIKLPLIFESFQAMLYAIISGITLSFMPDIKSTKNIINKLKDGFKNKIYQLKHIIESIVQKLFIPILPMYIFGFLLEINHQGVFMQLFQTYGKTFALIIFLQMLVLFFVYFLAAKFNLQQTIRYIKIAIPSYLTAFGTMSSTATIPVSVKAAEVNTGNKGLAEMAAPILANIHLLGDAISTPMLALVTIFIFQGVIPSLTTYAMFVAYFCINMLAVAGIPGGGIIVMIPILKVIL